MSCAARFDCVYSCVTATVVNLTLLINPSNYFLRYISVTKIEFILTFLTTHVLNLLIFFFFFKS